jgi:histidine triad (HIT) family protein
MQIADYQGNDIYCDVIIPQKDKLEIIQETENVLAYVHTKPHWRVHIVVTAKRHIASLLELSQTPQVIQKELLDVISLVAKKVTDENGACRVSTNLGEYQDSKHLHFHIYSE